eukprot:tig00000704_g3351.t1
MFKALFKSSAKPQGVRGPQKHLEHAVVALQGPRPTMEDRHTIMLNVNAGAYGGDCGFFGVFDGHGGVEAADYCAKSLCTAIVSNKNFPANISEAMKEGFRQLDDDLLKQSETINGASGSTATIALITDGIIYVGNVGDSRCVLSRGGRAVELSTDHTPFRPDEYTRIKKAGGWVDESGYLNGYISMSRAMGDADFKQCFRLLFPGHTFTGPLLISEPEIHEERLTDEDDFLILACDGLWKRLTSKKAVKVVRKALLESPDVQRAADKLVQEAIDLRTTDNVTAIVIMLQRPQWMKSDASISGGSALAAARAASSAGDRDGDSASCTGPPAVPAAAGAGALQLGDATR